MEPQLRNKLCAILLSFPVIGRRASPPIVPCMTCFSQYNMRACEETRTNPGLHVTEKETSARPHYVNFLQYS